jgi:hypothetical protein
MDHLEYAKRNSLKAKLLDTFKKAEMDSFSFSCAAVPTAALTVNVIFLD